jgi:hypothetical protein
LKGISDESFRSQLFSLNPRFEGYDYANLLDRADSSSFNGVSVKAGDVVKREDISGCENTDSCLVQVEFKGASSEEGVIVQPDTSYVGILDVSDDSFDYIVDVGYDFRGNSLITEVIE